MAKMCVVLGWTVLLGSFWCIREIIYYEVIGFDPYDLDNAHGIVYAVFNMIGGLAFEFLLFLTLGMNKKWFMLICRRCYEWKMRMHQKHTKMSIFKNQFPAKPKEIHHVADMSPVSTP